MDEEIIMQRLNQCTLRYALLATLTSALVLSVSVSCNDDDDDDNNVVSNNDNNTTPTTPTTGDNNTTNNDNNTTPTSTTPTTTTPPSDTARVQVLHLANAPAVDIYANDERLIDDLDPLAGTNFFEVGAGAELTLQVVAADAETNDAPIYSLTLDQGVAAGENYIIAAVGTPEGDAGTEFELLLVPGARVAASDDMNVAATVIHAATFAPSVNAVVDNDAALTIPGLSFGQFASDADGMASYVEVGAANTYGGVVVAHLEDAGTGEFIAARQTPPAAALLGGAVTIAAVGEDMDSFALVAFAANATAPGIVASAGIPLADAARVQLIHNSPDPAAASVDAYVDDRVVADALAFRDATPFLTLPAGIDLDLAVRIAGAEPDSDPVIAADGVQFSGHQIVVAKGFVEGADEFALGLDIKEEAMEVDMDGDEAVVPVLIYHGSPDAPAVGVDVILENDVVLSVPALSYGMFTDYVGLPLVDGAVIRITVGGMPMLDTAPIDTSAYIQPVAILASGASGLTDGIVPDAISGDVAVVALVAVFADGTSVTLPLSPAIQ